MKQLHTEAGLLAWKNINCLSFQSYLAVGMMKNAVN